ncbi:MAG: hypothetical protein OEM23_06140, partial [Gemmatimonadota bacterium]|nr:hypothetical protein [Gemmatimonadota bacterium]
FQTLYGSNGFPLGGTSSPLRVDLEYTSTQPPDYIPTPATFSGSTEWSDPEGDVDVEYLCFNGLARVRRGERVQLAFSGGVTFFSIEADVASLGYETFWLGGHGVLFSEIYELVAESERKTSVGANLGIELAIPLGDRWKVVGDVRAFLSPTVDLPLEPAGVANADQVIRDVYLADVGPLVPLPLDPSFVSLSVGMRMSL